MSSASPSLRNNRSTALQTAARRFRETAQESFSVLLARGMNRKEAKEEIYSRLRSLDSSLLPRLGGQQSKFLKNCGLTAEQIERVALVNSVIKKLVSTGSSYDDAVNTIIKEISHRGRHSPTNSSSRPFSPPQRGFPMSHTPVVDRQTQNTTTQVSSRIQAKSTDSFAISSPEDKEDTTSVPTNSATSVRPCKRRRGRGSTPSDIPAPSSVPIIRGVTVPASTSHDNSAPSSGSGSGGVHSVPKRSRDAPSADSVLGSDSSRSPSSEGTARQVPKRTRRR